MHSTYSSVPPPRSLSLTNLFFQVNAEDVLAFADRAVDTAEDAFLHLGRIFKKPAQMTLPIDPGAQPLPAAKKERVVVLGTGWGGHALSKVTQFDANSKCVFIYIYIYIYS